VAPYVERGGAVKRAFIALAVAAAVLVPSPAQAWVETARWHFELDGCRWTLYTSDVIFGAPKQDTRDKNGGCGNVTAYIKNINEYHQIGPIFSDHVTAYLDREWGQNYQVKSVVKTSRHKYTSGSGWRTVNYYG
jgi:hypothetical protein